ncbi:FG-GAP-like repeat-containing protein, partial [Fulvivirgaceae bacterium BMA10]|nr:FG-GAP-like repeat-containing protein [Fulvivirgaceae bacterium BMA10]
MFNRVNNLLLVFMLFFCQCGLKDNSSGELTIQPDLTFTKISPRISNVWFENSIYESEGFNYFLFPYIYGGGGVAIGDLNNDGLPDIYFSGNTVENRLYLNKGGLRFSDITREAGVGAVKQNRWLTGVSMADVNNDGLLDIYVCASGPFEDKKNLLFINKGNLTFEEQAEKYGLADEGFSQQGIFFDYDRDGDLDMYLCTYPPSYFQNPNQFYVQKQLNPLDGETDKLFRNENNAYFKDVTNEAGIRNFGLTLNASVFDANNDGWMDIYVSNDFNSADFFYMNNGDGTFTDKVQKTMAHTSNFGMGTDAADINNDGFMDLIQLDMSSEDNYSQKVNMSSMAPDIFYEAVDLGLHYQYMRNTVQLNNGNGTFSDIAELAGISNTGWSWAPLISDLNNDGWKDVLITNGIRRNVNNNDFNRTQMYLDQKGQLNQATKYMLLSRMPEEPIDNYVFVNNGNNTFASKIGNWGLSFKGFSHGASYADLDTDGDLDMVINNLDDLSGVYQNHTVDSLAKSNFISIQLRGKEDNYYGIGSKVEIITGTHSQFSEMVLSRGYLSSVEPVLHFGVGAYQNVDTIKVVWPNGCVQYVLDEDVNESVTIKQENNCLKPTKKSAPLIFSEPVNIVNHTHEENVFDDFAREGLLPHRMSQFGPALATGDVNGDGLDDFYVGGALGFSGALYVQDPTGKFESVDHDFWQGEKKYEDVSALMFDADSDGDKDLYVVSGGNEMNEGHALYQDRLYVNDGHGKFSRSEGSLPEVRVSGSRVREADYDQDGDLDLFVGGRQIPGKYPYPASSYLLRNDSRPGKPIFKNVNEEAAPVLESIGMVTDAVWVDVDQDDRVDLIVVGEWMSVTVLKNTPKGFEDRTESFGLAGETGWWYSVAAADFDKDGDIDLVGGNLGLNYKYKASGSHPFEVYASDFDENGIQDIVLGYYNEGSLYPLRGRECSSTQMPFIKKKFPTYNAFGKA